MVMQRLAVLAMVGVLGLGVTAAPAQAAGDAAAKPGKATARVAVTGDLVEPDGGVVKVNLHATERGDTDSQCLLSDCRCRIYCWVTHPARVLKFECACNIRCETQRQGVSVRLRERQCS